MKRWHRERGTKSNILYHSIMFVFYLLIFLSILGVFVYLLFENGFEFGLLFGAFLWFFPVVAHKIGIYESTVNFTGTMEHKKVSQKDNFIDKYISFLINHYNKKWAPAQFMCCSFSYLDPKASYRSFDYSLIKEYGIINELEHTYGFLYQCNKCKKYIFATESADKKRLSYMPVKNETESDKYSKNLDSLRTLRPILRGYDDFWFWKNKNYHGEIW